MEEIIQEYNVINNSFKEKCVYHVGIDAGFHSEVDAMMECMLFCYANQIKFVLYAKDANFAGGRDAYVEFFEPFCEMSKNVLNKTGNYRYNIDYGKKYNIRRWLLKKMEKAAYLTSDVFQKCIPREISSQYRVKWDLFDIDGTIFSEFGKLGRMVLRYNERTKKEVESVIDQLGLPPKYLSVQFRGGDKKLEFNKLNDVDEVMSIIKSNDLGIKDLFVFSDDYNYVEEVKRRYSEYTIFTLTDINDVGYDNAEFNKLDWQYKRKKMILLFAMIDVCIASVMHFGNEQTCVNSYIKSIKKEDSYCTVVSE